jgi:hypothetical protein
MKTERIYLSYEIKDRATDKRLLRFMSYIPEQSTKTLLQYATFHRRHLANTMLIKEQEEEITPTEEEINRFLSLKKTPKHAKNFLKYS